MYTVDLVDRLHTNKYLQFLKVIGTRQGSYIGQGKMNDTSYAVLRKQFNIYNRISLKLGKSKNIC